ncbi:Putrescine transport ATP-binding protein PotG [Rhodovulum sp. PH10]|uniref:ABC transporter ATP-binding protein n=1 Tax=Rhodovulum sp. PH10 TaxID=1187851 RepID=UPI00027C2592|nr:ABC transporter ATP-binding protein [Rhodovulum sp. PH10]EJW10214.1 Putrescine transport ATP-binding protein PotG [Rhodovulum sp. PH10]
MRRAFVPPDNTPPAVRFEAVTRRFGDHVAVDALSLDIHEGEFFALLGPSGCGKTTLLRMLAGFETPDAGRIFLGGDDIGAVPPHRRPVNMMFQSYALFPHLTVAGNVAFGLKQERRPKAEIAERVAAMLKLVRLEGMERRKPHQLSGGQRQRVALARALAKHPRVLLLDEPLAALDKKLREETQFELMELQARLGTTFVIVTHDQEEAMTVAHRIGVMANGRLVQVGPPPEIYEEPRSRWVAAFVGDVNLIEGTVVAIDDGRIEIADAAGRRFVGFAQPGTIPAPGTRVAFAVRPEKFSVTTSAAALEPDALEPGTREPGTLEPGTLEPGTRAQSASEKRSRAVNRFTGHVADIGYLGDVSVYKVRLSDGTVFKAAVTNATRRAAPPIAWDDPVTLSFPPDAAVVLTE